MDIKDTDNQKRDKEKGRGPVFIVNYLFIQKDEINCIEVSHVETYF